MTNGSTHREAIGPVRRQRRTALQHFLEPIMRIGRELLGFNGANDGTGGASAETVVDLCHELLDHRGEASALALADAILSGYQSLADEQRTAFLQRLAQDFAPRSDDILAAAEDYKSELSFPALAALTAAIEAPRVKLFGRLNTVPDGTGRIVKLRADVLSRLETIAELRPLEADLRHLLRYWFNRGFLVLEQVDWRSPASLLEKIVAYEAVHEVNGLEDLRVRLADDRRCFAFFHPAMPDDPLIFVQVALTSGLASAVAPLIDGERVISDPHEADTAVFYSITNCHDGLKGVSFGNFLIKQVVEQLRGELENIQHFATLSPVAGFRAWARRVSEPSVPDACHGDLAIVKELDTELERHPGDAGLLTDAVQEALMRLCAHYLLQEQRDQRPLDAVARFHLGNGAALERINWKADVSQRGLDRSFGIMVNYVYRPKDIETNHEQYFNLGRIAASPAVRKLARSV